ncbi:hypothetical protein TVAG_305510 [Trichomonas vaginalis G3]|uniref:Glycosyl transferase family 8 protein n=1 Tax=Trichomonas vaginalis (strain ATCC PRA-98 / G3) TaxID=412133 RepID=A2ERC5_TRIV3|nr:glycogenin subfamily member family [Trichomonas vaginalis G3]EAY04801.1 hypothetical protein TVAG_305510 [Trichomonas vaginalis G3]KAI5491002.1 glycogenin subfamily member family [Trichomonas vaginalis G3]|eukprot:XP_001317024.1 hypothetical protein [Trichomonas vaginalis G3]
MISFLAFFATCRTDPAEYIRFDVVPGIGEKDVSRDDDPMPTSKYAYVTYYSGDDHWSHYLLSVIVLGQTLASLSPKYDRVLLIPSKMEFEESVLKTIKESWTHIIHRPFIKWPCETKLEDPRDNHIWFKLQIFSLYQYSKVLYIPPNALVAKDPSIAFSFVTPSAPLDYQTWGYSHLGAVRNLDFLVVTPSQTTLDNVTTKGCNWIHQPVGYSREINQAFRGDRNKNIGPYDNGLIEEFYFGKFTTIPSFYQFELVKSKTPLKKTDPRIVTYRFPQGTKPWDQGPNQQSEIISDAWIKVAVQTHENLNLTIDLARYQLSKPTLEGSDFIAKKLSKPLPVPKYVVYDFYDEFEETNVIREILRYSSLVIGAVSLVAFAIADAPMSTRDQQEGGLMSESEDN